MGGAEDERLQDEQVERPLQQLAFERRASSFGHVEDLTPGGYLLNQSTESLDEGAREKDHAWFQWLRHGRTNSSQEGARDDECGDSALEQSHWDGSWFALPEVSAAGPAISGRWTGRCLGVSSIHAADACQG
jgi:hypothetical protein